MSSVLIRNGHVLDPATGINEPRDVLVLHSRVAGVERPGTWASDAAPQVLDASGCIVAPGLIDVHVHLREPGQGYKETIATGTAAAAAGGFTSVVAMPNTTPVNDGVATLEWMLAAERGACTRVFAMPAATRGSLGHELTDFAALHQAGAVGFTDDGKPVLEDDVMRDALVAAARLGVPISQHAENTRLTVGCSMNAGPMAFRLGLRGMSIEAEAGIVERDIALVRDILHKEKLRAHLHVQHVSTGRAMEMIRAAKAEGLRVTCEVTPHHFALNESAIGEYDTRAKMNPPLRAEDDRRAVIAAILDGTVDCIATDHAPHAAHEKEVEFERAPNGITGLETALGLALRVLHREHGLPLKRVIELMSTAPARLALPEGFGTLAVGAHGDVTIFDAGAEWAFDLSASRSRSRNSPFDGAPMLGRVRATVCAGRIVYAG